LILVIDVFSLMLTYTLLCQSGQGGFNSRHVRSSPDLIVALLELS